MKITAQFHGILADWVGTRRPANLAHFKNIIGKNFRVKPKFWVDTWRTLLRSSGTTTPARKPSGWRIAKSELKSEDQDFFICWNFFLITQYFGKDSTHSILISKKWKRNNVVSFSLTPKWHFGTVPP